MNIPKDRQPARGVSDKDPVKGTYAGTYTGDGKSLTRTSDGLQLTILDRQYAFGPKGSRHYIVVSSEPTRPYLSNLYAQEFDDRVHRYRIVAREDEPGTFDIVVLYRLKRRGRGRANGRA